MRPRIPITVIALGLVSLAGLVALFLAARYAFDHVTTGWVHATAAAFLIEAAIVFEAVAWTRTRNRWAATGLGLSFVVSGVYNYAQASQRGTGFAGEGILGQLTLLALALGPLTALAFVGMSFGKELRAYNEQVAQWEQSRYQLAHLQETWSIEKEKARLSAELEQAQEEHRQRLSHEERAFRAEMKQRKENRKDTGNVPEWLSVLPESRQRWNELVQERVIILPEEKPTGKEIAEWIPAVNSERVGRLWLGDVYGANGRLQNKG